MIRFLRPLQVAATSSLPAATTSATHNSTTPVISLNAPTQSVPASRNPQQEARARAKVVTMNRNSALPATPVRA
ncbi:MAG: hypothetical protein EOO16_05705 [Chitinophagaceae bacterium]|nr:MAG: hypothetical protein EOO16_05705 [Chitinophagaceae bacterium]